MYRKILVTLDGSPLAESVLPHAEALARQFDAEVILLQAVSLSASMGWGISDPASVELVETLRETVLGSARDYMQEQVSRLEARGVRARSQVVEGGAVDTILHAADQLEVDLIAMATHGRSGMGRWVYGSVAERVLRGATRPVLLVRSRE